MKVKIKTYNGEIHRNFHVNKEYECHERNSDTFFAIDEDGYPWICKFNNCPILGGGSWEIVE